MSDPFDRLVRDLQQGQRGLRQLVRMDAQAALGLLGVVFACAGIAIIVLAWSGVAHSTYVQQDIAYAVSGGVLGLALVIIGGFLYIGYLLVRHQRALQTILRERAPLTVRETEDALR